MTDGAGGTRQKINIELSAQHLARLDDLRADRNLSRDELIGELIEHAKPRRVRRRGAPDPGDEHVNPWAQVWPTGV